MWLTVDWCMLNRCAKSLSFKLTEKKMRKRKNSAIGWSIWLWDVKKRKKGYFLSYELLRLCSCLAKRFIMVMCTIRGKIQMQSHPTHASVTTNKAHSDHTLPLMDLQLWQLFQLIWFLRPGPFYKCKAQSKMKIPSGGHSLEISSQKTHTSCQSLTNIVNKIIHCHKSNVNYNN